MKISISVIKILIQKCNGIIYCHSHFFFFPFKIALCFGLRVTYYLYRSIDRNNKKEYINTSLINENKEKNYVQMIENSLHQGYELFWCIYWYNVDGYNKYRTNYYLNEDSVVFDVGGYLGDWSWDIYAKYHCNIYIFEPVYSYYIYIETRFKFIKKIKIYNHALSDKSETGIIHIADDASSFFINSTTMIEKVSKISIAEFIIKNDIKRIDLMKINIEGAEYDLIEFMLYNNLITIIKNIQIQFHNTPQSNSKERRKNIRSKLLKTHHITYYIPTVFENWELN